MVTVVIIIICLLKFGMLEIRSSQQPIWENTIGPHPDLKT